MDEVSDYGHGGTWLFFNILQDKGYLLEMFHFAASNRRVLMRKSHLSPPKNERAKFILAHWYVQMHT